MWETDLHQGIGDNRTVTAPCLLCAAAEAGDYWLPLVSLPLDQLQIIPGITADPLMFVLLEMILRSSRDSNTTLQAMNLLTQLMLNTNGIAAAGQSPTMALNLPMLGALVSTSKAYQAASFSFAQWCMATKLQLSLAIEVSRLLSRTDSATGDTEAEAAAQKKKQQQQGEVVKGLTAAGLHVVHAVCASLAAIFAVLPIVPRLRTHWPTPAAVAAAADTIDASARHEADLSNSNRGAMDMHRKQKLHIGTPNSSAAAAVPGSRISSAATGCREAGRSLPCPALHSSPTCSSGNSIPPSAAAAGAESGFRKPSGFAALVEQLLQGSAGEEDEQESSRRGRSQGNQWDPSNSRSSSSLYTSSRGPSRGTGEVGSSDLDWLAGVMDLLGSAALVETGGVVETEGEAGHLEGGQQAEEDDSHAAASKQDQGSGSATIRRKLQQLCSQMGLVQAIGEVAGQAGGPGPFMVCLEHVAYLWLDLDLGEFKFQDMPCFCGLLLCFSNAKLTGTAGRASSFRATVEAGSSCTEDQLPWEDAFAVEALSTFAAEVTSTFPVAFCCNNLGCSNLEGWSEMGQVGGRKEAGFCGFCGEAVYCSKACQEEHWREGHKEVCCLIQGHKNSSEAEREEAVFAMKVIESVSSESALRLLTAQQQREKLRRCVV